MGDINVNCDVFLRLWGVLTLDALEQVRTKHVHTKEVTFGASPEKNEFSLEQAAEKTKIQARNSRKKLNLRGALSSF